LYQQDKGLKGWLTYSLMMASHLVPGQSPDHPFLLAPIHWVAPAGDVVTNAVPCPLELRAASFVEFPENGLLDRWSHQVHVVLEMVFGASDNQHY
jgi:hypothetical protein